MKFLGVTILQGVEFPIFLLIFAWALQQCSATALPVMVVDCVPMRIQPIQPSATKHQHDGAPLMCYCSSTVTVYIMHA